MKHYIQNYLMRWRWAYILPFVLICGVQLLIVGETGTKVQPIPLAFYLGVVILSIDLLRGTAKIAYLLPLSKRDIGRAWWCLATVIPTTVCAAAKVPGFVLAALVSPDSARLLHVFVFGVAVDFIYASLVFITFIGMGQTSAMFESKVKGSVLGGLYGLLIGGWMLIWRHIPTTLGDLGSWGWLLLLCGAGISYWAFVLSELHAGERAVLRIPQSSSGT